MQYDAAQAAKADIYLNHLHNQKGYIKCHLNLLRTNKTPSAYLRLGDAYMKINSPVDAIESFSHALKLEPQNETLAIRIGDTLICSHEYKQAVSHYQEFLQTSPDSCRVQQNLTSLKQSLSGNQSLSMQMDKADEQIDLLVLCDVYLQQSKVDEALTLCIEFIETNSDHYKVTYKYVSLLSRLGKRDELNKISLQLDGTDETMSITGGHYLCQGLCQRMLGDPIAALKYFDLARNSKEWSQIASINMIQIYLRIDDFAFWCSSRSALALDEGSLKSASILINQQIDSDSNEAMILRGYWEVIKAFDNGNFDAPTKHFNGILKGDKDNIAALLGLAQVYTFSSTATKVRNTLKRIAKTPHDFEFMAEYERSYLMLAVDYIERDKVDLAHDLCKRCLFYNRFCAKAWELLGQTFELKNGCHTSDTIECYEKCWSIGNYRSCPVGYRLAALYLKTNRPVDGLKVALNCQNLAPDHVNIKSLISNCITSLKQ
jgi:tetratricopeptide repeat protein 21B